MGKVTRSFASSVGGRNPAARLGFILYVLGVCGLLAYTIRPTSPSSDSFALQVHLDERLELRVDYPLDWYLKSFEKNLPKAGSHLGFVISNHKNRFVHADAEHGAQAWDMRSFPDSSVVVEISMPANPTFSRCEWRVNHPPSSGALKKAFDLEAAGYRTYGAPERLWLHTCDKGTFHLLAHVWFFAESSGENRVAARQIIDSMTTIRQRL